MGETGTYFYVDFLGKSQVNSSCDSKLYSTSTNFLGDFFVKIFWKNLFELWWDIKLRFEGQPHILA